MVTIKESEFGVSAGDEYVVADARDRDECGRVVDLEGVFDFRLEALVRRLAVFEISPQGRVDTWALATSVAGRLLMTAGVLISACERV